jgi:hypothetical protein
MKWCLLISCLLAGCACAPEPQPQMKIAPPPEIPSQRPVEGLSDPAELEMLGWSKVSSIYLEGERPSEHARLERALAQMNELETLLRQLRAKPDNFAQEGGLKR